MAVAVGVGPLADFRPATAEADVAISWETAVLAVLCRREAPPPPSLRVPRSEPRHDDRWPELASMERWLAQPAEAADAVAAALASGLGRAFIPAPPTEARRLPRLHCPDLALTFVAIPGGDFLMGLSEDEGHELQGRLLRAAPESAEVVALVAEHARPVRRGAGGPGARAPRPPTGPSGSRRRGWPRT